MASAAAVAGLTARLGTRLGGSVHLGLPDEGRSEPCLPAGEPRLDALLGGFPRGRVTELVGPASAGKASLLLGLLERTVAPAAGAQPGGAPGASGEPAALVDPTRSLFPGGWAEGRLLVVRPRTLEEALKALDVLLAASALAVIGLHLPPSASRRLPEAVRVRTARLARESGTAVVACGTSACFGTYAALRVELAPAPDGSIAARVTKNRAGSMGSVELARTGFPFLLGAPASASPPPTAPRLLAALGAG